MMVMNMPMMMFRYPLKPTTLRRMRAAAPLTMIWSMYTMQKRQEHRDVRDTMVRKVPAPLSVMFHSSSSKPPLRRRKSQSPVLTLEPHTS